MSHFNQTAFFDVEMWISSISLSTHNGNLDGLTRTTAQLSSLWGECKVPPVDMWH